MSFLELKDVGKVYVSAGSVGVGIRGVNLSFDPGEFVVITGQSGSGKSTLLNVISGMDTYEEGEMYVDGRPTSHYDQSDFEEFRKKYISFIFQDYNIIESLTVLQNVELSLMHIKSVKERRARAKELLKKVGMEAYMRHKGSKLSGGQKQRTVIARALAKDSPVILADEPTGNLDSATSKEIIELIREVSKGKLVIIVTHDYDEVSKYATRHITVSNGSVLFDKKVKDPVTVGADKRVETTMDIRSGGKMNALMNGIRLGALRFSSKPKLALLMCFMFTVAALTLCMACSFFADAKDVFKKDSLFTPEKGRLVIIRSDSEALTADEVKELAAETGAISYERYDYLSDFGGDEIHYIKDPEGIKPSIGRLPAESGEILLCLPISKQPDYGKDEILIKNHVIGKAAYDVVGISYYYDNNRTPSGLLTEEGYRIASKIAFFSTMASYIDIKIYYSFSTGDVIPVSLNGADMIIVSHDINSGSYCSLGGIDIGQTKKYLAEQYGITNKEITYEVTGELDGDVPESMYNGSYGNGTYAILTKIGSNSEQDAVIEWKYTDLYIKPYEREAQIKKSINMPLDKYSYDTSPRTSLDALAKMSLNSGAVISTALLDEFMERYMTDAYTQASLIYKNDRQAKKHIDELNDKGYVAVLSNSEIKMSGVDRVINSLTLLGKGAILVIFWLFIGLLIALVTTGTMSAGAGEIGIMRSMGIPAGVVKYSIYVQTFISLIPAYFSMALFGILIFRFPTTNAIFTYLYLPQYLLIALALFIMAALLSRRYTRKMFERSVKSAIKEGVNV